MGTKVFYSGLAVLLALPHFMGGVEQIGAGITLVGALLVVLDR